MTRLIVTQAGREKSFDLIDDVIFIGSSTDCAIRLQGEGVDERHCQVVKVDGSYRVMNLGSSGTRVNGQPITQHELRNGDVIQVGAVAITFKGGVVPAQMTAQPAQPAQRPSAAPPSSARGSSAGAGVGRRPRRRAARGRPGREGREGREVKVAGHMQQAAHQRQVLTRQRVRRSGLSGPATIAIATGVSLVVIIFGYFMIRGFEPDEYGKAYERGIELVGQSRYEEARAAFESIPPTASNYRHAQEALQKMETRVDVGTQLKQHQHGESDYQSNILEFIRTKIETDNPDYKGDTAYVRVIVKRLENFLNEFKGHKREPEVKSFLAKYKPMVPDGPLTWHDIAVDADIERAREMYGPAYKTINDWIAAHPKADEYELQQAGRLRDKVVRGATSWWKEQDELALSNITSGNINSAYSRYLTALRRLKGMPDLYNQAKVKADRLKERAESQIVNK